jgi:hypothetical protein
MSSHRRPGDGAKAPRKKSAAARKKAGEAPTSRRAPAVDKTPATAGASATVGAPVTAGAPATDGAPTTSGNGATEAPGVPTAEGAAELARAIRPYMRKPEYSEWFDVWQRHNLHITQVHFYSPVPDTRSLSPDLWRKPSELVGIDMNDAVQMEFVRDIFPRFREEYEALPTKPSTDRFSLGNGAFSGTDALVSYCMVRHFQPRTIIEVGSGHSTLLTAQAALLNGETALHCIEPYPPEFLSRTLPGMTELLEVGVQDVPLEYFDQLGSGDILFIDSTHVVKIGSDVNHLIFEVLPRLKPGVVIHFHDIFLPKEMPWRWVASDKLFWTEQYLLRAFLAFNSEFEVLFGNTYMADNHPDDFKRTFPTSPWWGGGSFWIRRKDAEHSATSPAGS